jgi:hypothetical protein
MDFGNFDVWREEEDLPRLKLIGQALTAPRVAVEAFPHEPPDALFYSVYFKAPEVSEHGLFACVVPPGENVATFLRRWIAHIFPGIPIPDIDVVFPPP